MQIRPVTPTVGAVVTDVDLAADLSSDDIARLRRAWTGYGVLFFRGQRIDDADLVRFALRFGELQPSPMTGVVTHEITVLDTSTPQGEGADNWHSDQSFATCPPMGSVLRAVQLPASGGDTMFASMYAAYEALSAPMQRFLDGLEAVHDVRATLRRGKRTGAITSPSDAVLERFPPVHHPVVRTHPESGRKSLYVNENSTVAIAGMHEAESDHLLAYLFTHIGSPEIQCRFQWDLESVVFWDNRCTQHLAVADYTERRIMHRVTLAGDRPR